MHEHLADKRQIILIVRLTTNKRGQLLYGEIADGEGKIIGHFNKWQRLQTTMQRWLASAQIGHTEPD
jgi:hypothetical protein